jgi:hypothetical protein
MGHVFLYDVGKSLKGGDPFRPRKRGNAPGTLSAFILPLKISGLRSQPLFVSIRG